MLREALTSPPARPGANAGARSSTRPPARRPRAAGTSRAASARGRARGDRGRWPRSTAPTSLKPDSPTPGRPSSSTIPASRSHTLATAGQLEVLDVGGTRVRRAHQRQHASARGARRRHERLDRVRAHQRIDRHHVRAEPRRPLRTASRCRRSAPARRREALTEMSPRLPSAITSRPPRLRVLGDRRQARSSRGRPAARSRRAGA